MLMMCPYDVFAHPDDALRTDMNFSYTFNDQYRLVSYVFIQANDYLSNYDYTELGIGLQYQTPLPWLSFLAYYQQGHSKYKTDDWRKEYKPSLNLNLCRTFSGIRLYNQIRYEERFTPSWTDFRIKNYLEISTPGIILQPQIGWEMFYEQHERHIMLNRIKFGISQEVQRHVSIGPYYRIDFSRDPDGQWKFTRQLFGFQITLKY